MNGGTPSSDEANWDGDIPFVTPPDLRRFLGAVVESTDRSLTLEGAVSGSVLVDRGVILSNRAPIGYVARLDRRSAFNQGCKAVITSAASERYISYVLLAAAPLLTALGQGTTFMELSSADLARFAVPVPPPHLQQAIADFLDRETAKIDALIEKQNALIDRLRERRGAVVESVLDNTGQTVAFGYVVDCLPGYAFSSEDFSYDEEDIRLMRGVNVKPTHVDWTDSVYWPKEAAIGLRRFSLSAGDLVLGMDRPFVSEGTRIAIIDSVDLPCLLLQRVLRLRPRRGVSAMFVYYLLMTRSFLEYATPEFTGVSVPHISDKQVRSFRVPIPGRRKQDHIVVRLDAQLGQINALIEKAQRFVELARERRSALITAAVTGQLDVTEGAVA